MDTLLWVVFLLLGLLGVVLVVGALLGYAGSIWAGLQRRPPEGNEEEE